MTESLDKLQKLRKGFILLGSQFLWIYFLGPVLAGMFLGITKHVWAKSHPPVIWISEYTPGEIRGYPDLTLA